jgi:hypothetical protein
MPESKVLHTTEARFVHFEVAHSVSSKTLVAVKNDKATRFQFLFRQMLVFKLPEKTNHGVWR